MKDLVILQDYQAVTTSLSISDNFEKRHDHVLRDIKGIEKDVPNFGEMFHEVILPDSYGRERKAYLMSRDGFTLLAMSFTGKKALDFKLKYIAAFNEMEKQLNSSIPTTMVEALEMALVSAKENESLRIELNSKEQVIGELKPKADYTDRILNSQSLVTITQIAKDYGMSGQEMNRTLYELGVQFKQSGQWLLYREHQAKGYTHSETMAIKGKDGVKRTVMNTKWTQKGRLFLYKLLQENDILPVIERKD